MFQDVNLIRVQIIFFIYIINFPVLARNSNKLQKISSVKKTTRTFLLIQQFLSVDPFYVASLITFLPHLVHQFSDKFSTLHLLQCNLLHILSLYLSFIPDFLYFATEIWNMSYLNIILLPPTNLSHNTNMNMSHMLVKSSQ